MPETTLVLQPEDIPDKVTKQPARIEGQPGMRIYLRRGRLEGRRALPHEMTEEERTLFGSL